MEQPLGYELADEPEVRPFFNRRPVSFVLGFALGSVVAGVSVLILVSDEVHRIEKARRQSARLAFGRGLEGRGAHQHRLAHHRLAWKGAWERPMEVDEDSLDPLTSARMTDHNVRGGRRRGSRFNP